jgi:acetyltransferase
MIICIYLPFLGLKDIDVAKALMEIKAKNPQKPVIGVFMTKSEFFTALSDMDVNIAFDLQASKEALKQLKALLESQEGKL